MELLGKPLADQIKTELLARPVPEGEFVILKVGMDSVSKIYVLKKMEFADELKVKARLVETDEENISQQIDELNNDKGVRAIMIQLPLPASLDKDNLLKKINIHKDVDGFHYILNTPQAVSIPPTVLAVYELMRSYNVSLANGVLIVGGGFLVGRPLKKFLLEKNIKAEILEKNDPDYKQKLSSFDVVVVATGVGEIFDGTEFKEGASVIDASTVASEQQVTGDIKLSVLSKINLAPVPGGVGPVTVAMLFRNFYDLEE